ncbi:MAG: RluA family pseudouridine synthase [Lachnospiraceae bacterium]|nr:RluA family pseudouridine synthase [Lachnospiraceae bacterium]
MKEIRISSSDEKQKLIKFLHKYFRETSDGFLYKMLRKKNIVLNGEKADGKELLKEGDVLSVFFSDETFEKLRGDVSLQDSLVADGYEAFRRFGHVPVIFENEHILLLNKPSGILSQKASRTDLSLNEWMIGYLLREKAASPDSLRSFHPSVCNRLDRNTSGLVICGKTPVGSHMMSAILNDRSVHKFYHLFVEGHMEKGAHIKSYLTKDSATNTVTVSNTPSEDADLIETEYQPIKYFPLKHATLVEARLITGKTHQIRAHLASAGFPLVGDAKYGNNALFDRRKKEDHIFSQMLHAHRIVFPILPAPLDAVSGQTFIADEPQSFLAFQRG